MPLAMVPNVSCFRVWYHYEDIVAWTQGSEKPEPPLPDPEDAMDRDRFVENLPLQVFSCWNGATVFDASAFLPPHNIRFRTALNDLDEQGKPKKATEKASECFLSSVDMWKEGLGKILLVPKSRLVSVSFSPVFPESHGVPPLTV